ncbi:MAG: DUF4197 domain-containing protein [Gammaproteobacteria bacterium]|nr:DUF4197 domain-containing protein [Gammaproteobacteria bacterium]
MRRWMILAASVAMSAGLLSNVHGAGLKDLLPFKSSNSGAVSDADATGGFKQALQSGANHAVDILGRDGGFLNNDAVLIKPPRSLRSVEKGMRMLGKGDVADEFIASMNHAAESAVPLAANVFADTISHMSVTDAMGILKGGETSATDYLRTNSSDTLRDRFRPVVEQAMQSNRVTAKYQAFIDKGGKAAQMVGIDQSMLTDHVTDKALDGVFYMIAEQEKKIRADPAGQGSALISKVFGALKR